MTPYQEALKLTLGFEGGYYDGSEARDPNPTNYGVTQSTYDDYRTRKHLPTRSVKEIEQTEVEDIYRWYWEAAGCDKLPRLTAMCVFDHSINAGPVKAIICLQRALGVQDDGKFGPKTADACMLPRQIEAADILLASRLCFERIRYYVDLAKFERLRPNLLSWAHRVIKFREGYLK